MGLALLALAATCAPAACGSSSVGRALPPTELVALDTGASTSFDEYRGKPLVVNVWASWCTPCRTEMPAFEQVHQQVGDATTIIGLTDDADLEAARSTAETAGVTYPLVVDTDGRFRSTLAITGLPATVFVDADGQVVAVHNGVLDQSALLDQIGAFDDH
jgi:thiol-disulfide isomerase/thioredoxin